MIIIIVIIIKSGITRFQAHYQATAAVSYTSAKVFVHRRVVLQPTCILGENDFIAKSKGGNQFVCTVPKLLVQ